MGKLFALFTIDYLSKGDTAGSIDFMVTYVGLDSAKEVVLNMYSIAVRHFL